MRTRSTAGQATVEYVAAIALVAGILIVAAPAVGAPDLGRLVWAKFRLALCVVGGDVCTSAQARADGLAPCPLRSDTTGHEAAARVWIVEVGGKVTFTVTPQSDGTVSVVRAVGVGGGVTDGVGFEFSRGPLAFEIGGSGVLRERVQEARGWEFADQRAADEFLTHAVRHSMDVLHRPPAWISVDDTRELSGLLGLAIGKHGFRDRGDLVGFAGSGGAVMGGRVNPHARLATVYVRGFVDGPELVIPGAPSIGRGRVEGTFEYTVGRDGPRELAFRTAQPAKLGSRITETSARLDLRVPANLALAKSFIDAKLPWPPHLVARSRQLVAALFERGTVEETVSEVDDNSRGISGSARAAIGVLGGAYKRISVHKQLVSATARTGGPYERQRFDCLPQG